MDTDNTPRGNEKIYADLLQQLGSEDLGKKAAIKDLPVQSDGSVVVASFARDYRVSGQGVTAMDEGPVSFEQKLAVVSYLLSDGTGEPARTFVPFGSLGGFNIGRDHHALKNLNQPIIEKFGDNFERLAKAALKIGGIQKESSEAGKHGWLFHAFPKLPISLTYYEGDEDFPADVQVLFDQKALVFLGLSCLGFLPGYFTTTLLEAASAS